ncbi:MAG: hypothetical protein JXM79_04350 [Sedimentisphaerales bacterium]|nr:hypothetical protein [Sedimentisphaerales bacterium]
MTCKTCFIVLVCLISAVVEPNVSASPYAKWENGPPTDEHFFPIAVWLQSPRNAEKYRQAGINTYVGLWRGPTETQLADLKAAGMKVICHQNEAGLQHAKDPTIIAWMHGDEPDNAQSLGKGKGYGPPILPQKTIDDFHKLQRNDPTRPVLLNLGQGVAWDGWHGRGVRTNHPEDYAEYVKGCDIASFDIYPAVHSKPQVAGNLWYVAKGVERLVGWTSDNQIVWNCIECTQINNPETKATPHQVRCEVWMSIIHGSMGLIYFVHEWQPTFNEAALLSDPAMLAVVTATNNQIIGLAPVLNSPTVEDKVGVLSDNNAIPIAIMTKKYNSATYVFAVNMRGEPATATFTLKDIEGTRTVEVIDENRSLPSKDGVYQDRFSGWDVHLYRMK